MCVLCVPHACLYYTNIYNGEEEEEEEGKKEKEKEKKPWERNQLNVCWADKEDARPAQATWTSNNYITECFIYNLQGRDVYI